MLVYAKAKTAICAPKDGENLPFVASGRGQMVYESAAIWRPNNADVADPVTGQPVPEPHIGKPLRADTRSEAASNPPNLNCRQGLILNCEQYGSRHGRVPCLRTEIPPTPEANRRNRVLRSPPDRSVQHVGTSIFLRETRPANANLLRLPETYVRSPARQFFTRSGVFRPPGF